MEPPSNNSNKPPDPQSDQQPDQQPEQPSIQQPELQTDQQTDQQPDEQVEEATNLLAQITPVIDTYINTYVPEKYRPYVTSKRVLIVVGGIIAFIVLLLLLSLIGSIARNSHHGQNTSIKPTPKLSNLGKKAVGSKQIIKPKSQTLVYGTWTSQTSVIRAVDTATQQESTVATLPLTIKKVGILSNNELIYIDQTDSNDYGQMISIFNRQQQQITTSIPADPNFGIDDYMLSPNKRYLVMWELMLAKDAQTLQGGESRVYSVDLTQPTVTNQLYDEQITTGTPIHYPRAILNNGTVFTDRFIPNDPNGGAGWAYGMSIVNFDGSDKQDISSMTNGTYGSQPSLSPDGKFLLFAGYDSSKGSGTSVKNGYRQALLTPDTVELLDTNTLKRYRLPNLSTSNIYSDVQWDNQTSNVIISELSPSSGLTGIFNYNLGSLQMTQIPLPTINGTIFGYISELINNKTLIGIQSTNSSNLGNLGPTYSYAYTQLALLNTNGKYSGLSVEDPYVQYITILPQNYFNNVLGAQTSAQTTPQITLKPTISFATLQNPINNSNSFFKNGLASNRLELQSNPTGSQTGATCLGLGAARCTQLGFSASSSAYTVCQNIEQADAITQNACY